MQATILLLSSQMEINEQKDLIGKTIDDSALKKWIGPEPAFGMDLVNFMQFVGLLEENPDGTLADAYFQNRNELVSCLSLFSALLRHCNKNNPSGTLGNFA